MTRFLVTGSDGFIGRELCPLLRQAGHAVSGTTRAGDASHGPPIGDLREFDDWHSTLTDVETIVHLAGRAHISHETAQNPLEAFRAVNVTPTVRLARAAVDTGVKRLVFVSSIGVNGLETTLQPFRETDLPAPLEPYAVSKLEAEERLREIEASSELEVTIVRPPLVYGPGVKGNFLRLLKLVRSRIPIPVGAVDNSRSFVGLTNLCNLLEICATHTDAAGETFLAADGTDVSTRELLRTMSQGMGLTLWLPPIPLRLLQSLSRIVGRGPDVDRLTRSLQVDATRARDILGWRPSKAFGEGLFEMTEWYMRRNER